MTRLPKLVCRFRLAANRIERRVWRWSSNNIEAQLTQRSVARWAAGVNVIGNFQLLPGYSPIYTWRVSDATGQPTNAIKAVGILGFRPRWVVRKPSELYEPTTPIERIRHVAAQARRFHEQDCGPSLLAEAAGVVCLSWVDGRQLVTVGEVDPAVGSRVTEKILELAELGIHHGDLHCGNVLIDSEGRVNLIDSDKQFRNEIPPDIALAADIATLIGSICAVESSSSHRGLHRLVDAIRESAGSQLIGSAREVSKKHSDTNRWLGTAAGIL